MAGTEKLQGLAEQSELVLWFLLVEEDPLEPVLVKYYRPLSEINSKWIGPYQVFIITNGTSFSAIGKWSQVITPFYVSISRLKTYQGSLLIWKLRWPKRKKTSFEAKMIPRIR